MSQRQLPFEAILIALLLAIAGANALRFIL